MRVLSLLSLLVSAMAEQTVDIMKGLKIVHEESHLHPDNRPYREVTGNHQPYPDRVSVHFTAFGRQFDFEDGEVVRQLAPGMHVVVNDTKVHLKHRSYTKYHDDGHSTVTLLSDTHLTGAYFEGSTMYFMGTVKELLAEKDLQTEEAQEELRQLSLADPEDETMIMLKLSHEYTAFGCGTNHSHHAPPDEDGEEEHDIHERPVKRPYAPEEEGADPDDEAHRAITGRQLQQWDMWDGCFSGYDTNDRKEIEIHLISDYGLASNKGAGFDTYIESLMAQTNAVYLGQLKVNIKLAQLTALAANSAKNYNDCSTSIDDMLTELRTERAQDGDAQKYGMTALINRCWAYGTVGLAYVDAICSSYAAGVSSSQSSSHFLTFAHECGHNFGGGHSFEDGQGQTGGIMDYGYAEYLNVQQFNTKYRKTEMCKTISDNLNQALSPSTNCFSPYVTGVCGNDVVDAGEDCEGDTACCDGSTCSFKSGNTCETDGDCCTGCTLKDTCGWCEWTNVGQYYQGYVSSTASGKTCQKWSSSSPHQHQYTSTYTAQGDHNYCRNPGGLKSGPWCYTTDANTQWELCDVGTPTMPKCGLPEGEGIAPPTAAPPTPPAPTPQCDDVAGWVDSDGWTCEQYVLGGYCGPNAEPQDDGFFEFACALPPNGACINDGLIATDACCECGGGNKENQCPRLEPPAGSSSTPCIGVLVGETCTFACSSGYTASGSGTRSCGADLTWSGNDDLVCTETFCPTLRPVAPATGTTCSGATPGEECTFACPVGYSSNNFETRTCQAGSWTGFDLVCTQLICPTIFPPNGALAGTGRCEGKTQGETCVMACAADQVVAGSATRTCDEGKWDGEPFSCSKPAVCPELNSPAGAVPLSCIDKTVGETCLFRCDVGYTTIGGTLPTPSDPSPTNTMTCMANTPNPVWDKDPIGCAQTACPNLSPPQSAIGGACRSKVQGEICSFQCVTGYEGNGFESRTCLNGDWSGEALACSPKQCSQLNPPGDTKPAQPCIGKFHGQSCNFECKDGFVMSGDTTRECMDGSWTGFALVCSAPTADYGLTASDWGPCSASCGGGTSTRTVQCLDLNTETVVDKSFCADAQIHEVADTQDCNLDSCVQAEWVVSDWGDCSRPCGGGEQTRQIVCKEGTATVDDNYCGSLVKPQATQTCGTAACVDGTFHWVSGRYSECSATCGGGVQTRVVECRDALGNEAEATSCAAGAKPAESSDCNTNDCALAPKWNICEWEECTAECGGAGGSAGLMSGVQARKVYCTMDDERVAESACSILGTKPTTLLVGCNPQACSAYNWMTTEWGPCSAITGKRIRSYHCHDQNGGNALNSDCPQERIPSTEQSCTWDTCPSAAGGEDNNVSGAAQVGAFMGAAGLLALL